MEIPSAAMLVGLAEIEEVPVLATTTTPPQIPISGVEEQSKTESTLLALEPFPALPLTKWPL